MHSSRLPKPPRTPLLLFFCLLIAAPVQSRQDPVTCGTHRDRAQEEFALHQRAVEQRRLDTRSGRTAASAPKRPITTTVGDLVLMADSDGVVSRRNSFDLDGLTLVFSPTAEVAGRYRFELGEASFEDAAASGGELLEEIGDDDAREIPLPFSFPFFGVNHDSVFINSDGNLTFNGPDVATSPRTLNRITAGPPRIAPLFDDLDPTRALDGIRVLSEPSRFVVSWVQVPEYSSFGRGPVQTFQVRLYPNGLIEFAYNGITAQTSIVAISPGDLQGTTRVVSFSGGSNEEFDGTLAENFTTLVELDIYLAAQKFFEEHDDAYDYLVFYNNTGISAGLGVVAYEISVRNWRSGIGDPIVDFGREVGSPNRLQALLNLGPLSQYPEDPNAFVPARAISGDTPLTVLAHEAGHLFLAFASVRNPDTGARPMLGRDEAHWNFTFNSEASLLEGNRICDREFTPNTCPTDTLGRRFITTATVEGYSPLDQYLMGFRDPLDVPDMFVVEDASIFSSSRAPQAGVSFNGVRRNIRVDELIETEGRRTPDHTVSQRHFRFAFVLVHAAGQMPSAEEIEQVDRYRREFEAFYGAATGGRATASTRLARRLGLSTFPASGLVPGGSAQAIISIERPAETDTTVLLASENGGVAVPRSATILAGAATASFEMTAMRPGVDEITAMVPGDEFEVARSKVQVGDASVGLRLELTEGDRQPATPNQPLPEPVVVRVTDINRLPYAGVAVRASASAGGAVSPEGTATDSSGFATFSWTPGAVAGNQLTVSVDGGLGVLPVVAVTTGEPISNSGAVVESAGYSQSISPGALATIFGGNLAAGATAVASFPIPTELEGVRVLLGGTPLQLLYVSDTQINFVVSADAALGPTNLRVTTPLGDTGEIPVTVVAVSPGVFVMGDLGIAAATVAGTGQLTSERPAAPGNVVEIFCTGLGAVEPFAPDPRLWSTVLTPAVRIGGVDADVQFSGLAPGMVGLYQVNAEVPQGVAPGSQPLSLSIGGVESNGTSIVIAQAP